MSPPVPASVFCKDFVNINYKNSHTVTKRLYVAAYVMRCAIWYDVHNSKNVKNTHGGVLN